MLRRTFIQLFGLLPTIPFLPVLPTVEKEEEYELLDFSMLVTPKTFSIVFLHRVRKPPIRNLEFAIAKAKKLPKLIGGRWTIVKHREYHYTLHSYRPCIRDFMYYFPEHNVAYNYESQKTEHHFLPPPIASLALDAYKEGYI